MEGFFLLPNELWKVIVNDLPFRLLTRLQISSRTLHKVTIDSVTRIELGTVVPLAAFQKTLKRNIDLTNIMGVYKFLYVRGFAITSLRVEQYPIGMQCMEDLLAVANKAMPNLRTLELVDVKPNFNLREVEKMTSLTTLKLISFKYFEASLPKALVNLERLVLKPDFPSMGWVGCGALLCLKRLQHLSLCSITLLYQELRELFVGMPQLKTLELAPHNSEFTFNAPKLPHDYLPRLFEGNPLPELRGLYICDSIGTCVNPRVLSFLTGMPSLRSVHLDCPVIGDYQVLFEILNACVGLTELGLSLPILEVGLPIGELSNLKTLSALYLVATPKSVPPWLTEKVFSTFPNMVDFKYNQEGSVFRGMPLSI